jgi:hypothetical protein
VESESSREPTPVALTVDQQKKKAELAKSIVRELVSKEKDRSRPPKRKRSPS